MCGWKRRGGGGSHVRPITTWTGIFWVILQMRASTFEEIGLGDPKNRPQKRHRSYNVATEKLRATLRRNDYFSSPNADSFTDLQNQPLQQTISDKLRVGQQGLSTYLESIGHETDEDPSSDSEQESEMEEEF